MVRSGRRLGAIAGAVALALIAGCAPSAPPTPTPTPTPTPASSPTNSPVPNVPPTPTPAWDAEQTAAIEAVEGFIGSSMKILADPSAFTSAQMSDLLATSSGGEALAASVGSFETMREKGYRVLGAIQLLSTVPTDPVDDGRGAEVHVTVCQDQTSLRPVDTDGNAVTEDRYQYPDFLLRQFSVRKPPGEAAFLVFGFQTINGACP